MIPMNLSESQPVVIIGAGGHALVLIEILRRLDATILGATTIHAEEQESILGVPIIGGDENIRRWSPSEIVLVNAIGMVSTGRTSRVVCAAQMRSLGYAFRSVIDPWALVSESANLGEGCQVMAGAIIQPNVTIGPDTIINTGAKIDHDCYIARDCHICPGTTLTGGVNIGKGSILSAGVVVVPEISIRENSFIKAGTVVKSNVT